MRIQLKFFALAKDLAGSDAVELDLPDGATVADLRRHITEQFPALTPLIGHTMIAVNAQYATDATTIPPNSEVAIIPPVSGG